MRGNAQGFDLRIGGRGIHGAHYTCLKSCNWQKQGQFRTKNCETSHIVDAMHAREDGCDAMP
jgi:hypothetical protein